HVRTGDLRPGDVWVEPTRVMAVLGRYLSVDFTDLPGDPHREQKVQTPPRGVLQISWIPQRRVALVDRFYKEVDLWEVVRLAVVSIDRSSSRSLDNNVEGFFKAI